MCGENKSGLFWFGRSESMADCLANLAVIRPVSIDACSADIEPASFYVAFLTTLRPFARRTMRHNNYLRGDQCRLLHSACDHNRYVFLRPTKSKHVFIHGRTYKLATKLGFVYAQSRCFQL